MPSSSEVGRAPLVAAVARVVRGAMPLEPLETVARARLAWTLVRHQHALDWVRTVETRSAGSQPAPRLFGVVVAWMEADVIESTVRNLLRQGCERVYLVDNDSPDDTVAVAQQAGAVLGARVSSHVQDEFLLRTRTNQLTAEVDQQVWSQDGAVPIWWLHVDADEFPHGPDGRTVGEHVASLAPEVRVVGTVALDHWPTEAPAFVAGAHPVDHQPWCTPRWSLACDRLHWKHQLVRHDPDRPIVLVDIGCHRALGEEHPLHEAARPIVVHHAPFREESTTRARLAALGAARADGTSRLSFNRYEMAQRGAQLDAVYGGRWREVLSANPMRGSHPVHPGRFEDVVPRDLRAFARWY